MAEVSRFPSENKSIELPDRVKIRIAEFMLDKRTGNVVLNILDGEIKSFHVEEIERLK